MEEPKRRTRCQTIAFTYTAEDKIIEYMDAHNVTFNKAVNEIIEKCKTI